MTAIFRSTLLIQAVLAVFVTSGSWFLGGQQLGLAVLVSALVAIADLALLALIVRRLFDGERRHRVVISILLGLKFPALIGAVYLMLNVWGLSPLGAILGFSTLVVAVLYASVVYGLQAGKEQE